jgi:hypothetical protein
MNFEFSPTSINFGTTLESSPTTGINIGTNTFDINKSVIPITETPKNQTLTINDNYKDTFSTSSTSEKPSLTETLLFNPSTTNTSIFTNINTSTNQNIINTINFDDPNITFGFSDIKINTNTFNVDNEWINNADNINFSFNTVQEDLLKNLIEPEAVYDIDELIDTDILYSETFVSYDYHDDPLPNNYYYSDDENSEIRAGSPEFHALTKEDQGLILGQLNTETAQKNAVEELTSWGVPRHIALAIVTNNTESLKEKTKGMSSETASKYLSLAGLSITENTQYESKILGLTIS